MISSTPYDPENPFRAAVSNDGSAKNIPSTSRTNSGRHTMQDVSLEKDDDNNSERDMDDVKKDFEGTDALLSIFTLGQRSTAYTTLTTQTSL